MIEIQAPHKVDLFRIQRPSLFLAGSIEMGTAEDWQDSVISRFKDYNITILNPRRDDWDSSWRQDPENENFLEQVKWELLNLEAADIVGVYFDPETKSPITMMELGSLKTRFSKVVVCCPEGFWKRGNVEIFCSLYDITFTDNYMDFIKTLKTFIVNYNAANGIENAKV